MKGADSKFTLSLESLLVESNAEFLTVRDDGQKSARRRLNVIEGHALTGAGSVLTGIGNVSGTKMGSWGSLAMQTMGSLEAYSYNPTSFSFLLASWSQYQR